MNLTNKDIEMYAPFHTMEAFRRGYYDYFVGRIDNADCHGVARQAYDRGAECAVRHVAERMRHVTKRRAVRMK